MTDPNELTFAGSRTATPALTSATLRSMAEDFAVEEQMPYSLAGSGEHLWIKLRKRGFNSEQVAKLLARTAGVTRREVGYAGMKDRHAVTVQWFSLHLAGRPEPDWTSLPDGILVLESVRHSRKLKTGALAGNRFEIVLRDCQGDHEAAMRRAESMRAHGVPNYFGEQRFGFGGGNVAAARALFAGGRPARDRKQSGIYLSAARSLLFNAVLAQRVAAGTWNQVMAGDALILNGSRSFFVPAVIDDIIHQRLAGGDVHPSGPLWGRGQLATQASVRALEQSVATAHADLAHGLETAGLEQERRALRVIPQAFNLQWQDASTLRVSFALPPGSYATMVLRELADYRDVSGFSGGEETA